MQKQLLPLSGTRTVPSTGNKNMPVNFYKVFTQLGGKFYFLILN
jgi:hypothetical protein